MMIRHCSVGDYNQSLNQRFSYQTASFDGFLANKSINNSVAFTGRIHGMIYLRSEYKLNFRLLRQFTIIFGFTNPKQDQLFTITGFYRIGFNQIPGTGISKNPVFEAIPDGPGI